MFKPSSVLYIVYFFSQMALQPNAGYGLLINEVFRDHTYDAPQSVGLLWTSDQFVAETSQPDNTQHSQQTHIHAPGGIRTHDLSGRAAVDLRYTMYEEDNNNNNNNNVITHCRTIFARERPLCVLIYVLYIFVMKCLMIAARRKHVARF
jgi:hypothetical protein